MRNQIRREMTQIATFAMWGILGRASRRLRRHFGRMYAKEAYRQMQGLPLRHSKGSALVTYIVDEFSKRRQSEQNLVAEGIGSGGIEESSQAESSVGRPAGSDSGGSAL